MATGKVSRDSAGIAQSACGIATGDGTALSVTCGWRPKFVTVFNKTDVIKHEKIDGMLATETIKTVTAGTMTLDTTSAIVLTDRGFIVSAAMNGAADALVWFAR